MYFKSVFSLFMVALLTACGSTSNIKSSQDQQLALNLPPYKHVVVMDFGDATKKHDLPEFVGREFADRIAAAIRGKQAFINVTREPIDEPAIIISGNVTRYKEGSGALKVLVGFGAGSTYFDADVTIVENQNNEELATMFVDKNSWPLGGFVSGAQNVDGFMDGAAKKIAKELAASVHNDTEPGQPTP